MRTLALVSSLFLLAAPAATRAEEALSTDQAAVVKVVTEAYVDGIHNFRDPAAIRAGFHPEFEMLVLRDGELEKLPIAQWIERIEARNAAEGTPPRDRRPTEARFVLVDVTGDAAICKVELSREGKKLFTDYLSLYRFAEGWKIAGKIFQRH